MKFLNILKETQYKFIFFGSINIFLSNIILQILLLYISTVKATFLSQMFNYLFGFYFYGKRVFKIRKLRKGIFLKYFILVICLWNINWLLIDYFHSFGISKNIVSLVIVPFLALISYLTQKYFVFNS